MPNLARVRPTGGRRVVMVEERLSRNAGTGA
jgi:hypothetical protein